MEVSNVDAATGVLEIPVVLAEDRSSGRKVWKSRAVGMIRAGDLYGRYSIPQRDHRRKTGYQRELSQTRVNRLVKELRDERVDLPTSILVNFREFVLEKNLDLSGPFAILRIDTNQDLHVVDGQHRVAALSRLIEEDPERWADYEIAFVSMLGADALEEMREFYVVNSTAKSVRTDLALDLLKQQAEADPVISESLIETNQTWKVKGQTLTEEMNKTSLWRGLIRFPGDPKGVTTIGSASMVSSLKPLLGNPYFSQITSHNQLKVLDAYWRGIQQVIPEPFEEPSDFSLQKGLGAMIMNGFLVFVLENVNSRGESVVSPDSYANVLVDVLSELEGDTSEGDVARGADFWRAGGEGAAGSYSSSAGRRVLTAKLRSNLPAIEVV